MLANNAEAVNSCFIVLRMFAISERKSTVFVAWLTKVQKTKMLPVIPTDSIFVFILFCRI